MAFALISALMNSQDVKASSLQAEEQESSTKGQFISSLSEWPYELQADLLKYVDGPTLSSLRGVSKGAHRAVYEELGSRFVAFHLTRGQRFPVELQTYLGFAERYNLCVSLCVKSPDLTTWQNLVPYLPRIRALDLRFMEFKDDENFFADLARYSRRLWDLTLFCPVHFSFAGLDAFRGETSWHLTRLVLNDMPLRDEQFSYFLNQCGQLRTLSLDSCEYLSDEGFHAIGRLAKLQNLELIGLAITGETWEQIAGQCTSLTSLTLQGCDNLKRDDFLTLTSLSRLESLCLSDSALDGPSLKVLVPSCTGIKSFRLDGCLPLISNDFLCLINLTRLRHLDVSHTAINSEALSMLEHGLPNCNILSSID
ncbi:MAG: hypothetical protein ACK5O7_01400 [Holosporales bacterium]